MVCPDDGCLESIIPVLGMAKDDWMHMLVPGNYLLVGKAPDSEFTYHGKVEIKEVNDALLVLRDIDGEVCNGSAAIEPALDGDANVLRIRYSEGGVDYEQTCLVSTDLDNYARISCYVYHPDVHTSQPGLEVLFHDHTAE